MYPEAVICPQVEDELITDANRPQVGDDLQIIFRIPWGHNKIILDKCKGNSAKALFYIRKTIENNWSRDVLLNFLGTDLYERQGKAITNFSNTLPIEQSDLAQAITKDPYNFDFLTLRERYDEKELKDALIEKVNNFLMELGTGSAYMGREVRIEVGDTEKFIDMAFANAFLGVNHSLAHKLGAFHHIPHGIANALVLTEVMRYNAAEVPTKMGTFPQYQYPKTLARYAEIGRSVGLTGKDDQEVFEKLLEKLEELKKIIEIKPTIKDYGVDEKYFLETLDEMTEQAFNDQCTGTNPRYPLMSELKEIYLKAYYGEGNVPESRKAKEKKETK